MVYFKLKFLLEKTQLKTEQKVWKNLYIYSAPSVYRPPFYRQPHLSPKFSSVPISPIKNTLFSYRHLFNKVVLNTNSIDHD